MNSKFKLHADKKKEMISSIQAYFLEEREEEIGELAATLLLDFFIDELAPEFYNLGIEDSYHFMNERLEDLFAMQK
ncbi:DUF2164 domain-containing protein [Priestia megaterium]|nr:DUF2164 domain-containing protein [Priestia megaterium]